MTESKIHILNERLKSVVEKFEALKKCGMDEELLIIFVCDRTKLSKKNVKKMLLATEEFYNKLTDQELMEQL